MQHDRELRDLARAIATFRRRGDGRYPTQLRARITAWVIAQRACGEWWTDISAALAIPTQTLVRWAEAQRDGGEMRVVDVIDAPPAGTVTLVASSGLRIEGVAIEAAIAILRGLA